MGAPGWDRLQRLGVQVLRSTIKNCALADGSHCTVLGSADLPMTLAGRTKVIHVLIMPSLPHQLILGINFWETMGVVPDLRNNAWHFTSQPDARVDTILASSEGLCPDQQMRLAEFEIKTDSPPVKQRFYPTSPYVQKHIDQELKLMLAAGIIEPSSSAWSSPVLMVPKPDGTYRFCVDFRKLNAVTTKDAYPIPYVSAILNKLRKAKYMSSLDIKSAFWQIKMSESSKHYTAFTVPGRGLYQFTRMPFGVANGPSFWQRLADKVIGPDLEPYVFVYLDDIIIVTDTFEHHMELLQIVLQRLKDANVTVSKDKCKFLRGELRYLGYLINKDGLNVDPDKVKAILNVPVPATVKEVRSFLGVCSWYRRFIPDFATRMAPLNALLKKDRKTVEWNEACDKAFTDIKSRLVTAPVLSCPDYERGFKLQCDSSSFGLGVVLTQDFDDGEKVVCYLSRSLTAPERNYSTIEREFLAVVWGVEQCRSYIEGVHFTVVTDHFSLKWLQSMVQPKGKICRWILRLQPYSYDVVHRKGKEHLVPDLLSRSVPVIDAVDLLLLYRTLTGDYTVGCCTDMTRLIM